MEENLTSLRHSGPFEVILSTSSTIEITVLSNERCECSDHIENKALPTKVFTGGVKEKRLEPVERKGRNEN